MYNMLCFYPSITIQDKAFEVLSLTAYCHVELVETLTGSGFRTVNGF